MLVNSPTTTYSTSMHAKSGVETQQIANGHQAIPLDSTRHYLEQIGEFELLDGREAEVELFKILEQGGVAQALLAEKQQQEQIGIAEHRELSLQIEQAEEARQEIWQKNLRLVVATAKKWRTPPGVEQMDLIQEGNEGLEHAIRKFDWRRGFKFSTYAVWWIDQRIRRHINQRAKQIFPESGTVLSIDASNGGNDDSLLEFVGDSQMVDETEQIETLNMVHNGLSSLLEVLTDREFEALTQTENHSSQTLAEEKHGKTKSDLQNQYTKKLALAKLRHPSNSHIIEKLNPDGAQQIDSWQFQAACYGLGSAIGFFPYRGESTVPAKEICEACPVKEQCSDFGINNAKYPGIWGGMSQRQRRKKRQRKLPDTEQNIQTGE